MAATVLSRCSLVEVYLIISGLNMRTAARELDNKYTKVDQTPLIDLISKLNLSLSVIVNTLSSKYIFVCDAI